STPDRASLAVTWPLMTASAWEETSLRATPTPKPVFAALIPLTLPEALTRKSFSLWAAIVTLPPWTEAPAGSWTSEVELALPTRTPNDGPGIIGLMPARASPNENFGL